MFIQNTDTYLRRDFQCTSDVGSSSFLFEHIFCIHKRIHGKARNVSLVCLIVANFPLDMYWINTIRYCSLISEYCSHLQIQTVRCPIQQMYPVIREKPNKSANDMVTELPSSQEEEMKYRVIRDTVSKRNSRLSDCRLTRIFRYYNENACILLEKQYILHPRVPMTYTYPLRSKEQ